MSRPPLPRLLLGLGVTAAVCALPALHAQEATRGGLPVREGLVLHVDAGAQAELRRAAALPPIGSGQPVDIALDSSDAGLRATQLSPERRPRLLSDGVAAALQFDGKDDCLAFTGERKLAAAVTVFVLAAPRSNPGLFSALLSTAEAGKNDYTSGLNLDFGPAPTPTLGVLNLETAGAGGFQDLLVPGVDNAAERPFGGFHVFTARSRIARGGNEVFLDGFPCAPRDRLESFIGLDAIALGARLYSNDGSEPPFAQGSFSGWIAEALVYDRALSDRERVAVEERLLARTVDLQALVSGARGHALETVADPPVLQMLVPGFTAHELPVRIGNLDNVRYRHDGRLVGLGYDGRIHLLEDTDGDGLEDHDTLFWGQTTMRGPIGMALLAAGDPRGDGAIVASKGKVSLILDADRDGVAEEEVVIASGWQESFHSVDTLGVAVDPRDGSICFGLGCANFADPYLIDRATGRSAYDVHSTHGTVQRLSADFSHRETICTGVRFTCALAFNREGDLFVTEQEGATWCANGNPLDELLHIEPGKHYGFPPRHPRHNPGVIDEPSVVEFGPQHQSTVGMVFNEGVNGGPSFGPACWEGDAIVCGESRGKLWRTKLAKTPLGYVGQRHLIACLNLLTIDACVSPAGTLVVACHSGPPDWGTGPTGEGRLFQVRYSARDLPQPVIAWAAAPDELRVAFDRELDPADWADARKDVRVEAGPYVGAGDRFETVRPGYQVVRDQLGTPRRWVDVLELTMAADRRTLALRIPRQEEAVTYAITLPLPSRWGREAEPTPTGVPAIAQHPQIDVQATLTGVLATVRVPAPAGAEGPGPIDRACVLPHPGLAVCTALAAGSADHEAFLAAAASPGAEVRLRGLADVSNPFVPAVQPGARLDWSYDEDPFASTLFELRTDWGEDRGVEATTVDPEADARPYESGSRMRLRAFEVPVTLRPDRASSGLYLAHESLRRPLSTARLLVPWARAARPDSRAKAPGEARTDVNGRWLHGRELFFAKESCATCHQTRGEGIALGPDLSNLIHRDRDSVLQDILEPSAAINPDQVGSALVLADGTALSGLLRVEDAGTYVLRRAGGEELRVARAEVLSVEPLGTSLMPDGLLKERTPRDVEDLLTFLLVSPLEPAPITRSEPSAPPSRTAAEVARVLGAPAGAARPSAPPLRILLCAGPKDHGLDEHDYPVWLERWARLLPLADGVTVETASSFPSREQLERADVAIFNNANPGWSAEAAALLDAFHARGGGAVYIHYGIAGADDPAAVAERTGLSFAAGSRFRHGPLSLVFARPEHPITRGLPSLELLDESYWALRGDASRVEVLATSLEDGAPRPQVWTLERREGRIVSCIPGHYTWTLDDPLVRVLILRAIAWAARCEDVDRLSALATVGARVAP